MGDNVGVGLGLSATSNTARDFYMTGQQREQRRAMAEYERRKQDDQDFAKLADDFSQKGYKWHRLLRDEAIAASTEKVDQLLKLKSSGDPNWKNQIPKLEQEYNSKMTELVSLNEQYNNFDDQTKIAGQNGTYMPENIYKAWNVFNNSKDRFDLAAKFTEKGIQTDPRGYFAYNPDKGDINVLLPKAVNLDQEMKKASDLVPTLLAVSEQTWVGDKYTTTQVKKRFKTREEAKAELSVNPKWYPGYSIDNLPPTLEDVRDELISDRNFYFQYVDSKQLGDKTVDEVKEVLLDELAINSGLKQTQKFGQKAKGTTIVNNMGTDGETNKAQPSWGTDTFNAGSINPGKQPAEVAYIGTYQPALPNMTGSIEGSVFDAYGVPVKEGNIRTYTDDSKFTGFFVMPYWVTTDDRKVPYTSMSPKSARIAGFTYFAQIHNGNSVDGIWFQPYEKFVTAPNNIKGTEKERAAVTTNAQIQMNQTLQANANKIKSIPKPASYNDWKTVKAYIDKVGAAIQ